MSGKQATELSRVKEKLSWWSSRILYSLTTRKLLYHPCQVDGAMTQEQGCPSSTAMKGYNKAQSRRTSGSVVTQMLKTEITILVLCVNKKLQS